MSRCPTEEALVLFPYRTLVECPNEFAERWGIAPGKAHIFRVPPDRDPELPAELYPGDLLVIEQRDISAPARHVGKTALVHGPDGLVLRRITRRTPSRQIAGMVVGVLDDFFI